MTCPHGVWVGACATCKPIHSSRDQAWHFTHPTLGRIDSKGEFDRRCKAKGLVRVSTDELMTRGEPTRPSLPTLDRKQIETILREELPKSRNPELVAQKEQEQQRRLATPLSPVGVEYVGKEA